MGSVIDAIWDDIRYGDESNEAYYFELSEQQKEKLVSNLESGTPFTNYWVRKTLAEINPLIVNYRYISSRFIVQYLNKLMQNSGLLNSDATVQVSDTTGAK